MYRLTTNVTRKVFCIRLSKSRYLSYRTVVSMDCLVTRPDVPLQMITMLESSGIRLDIWKSESVIPECELLRRIEGKKALICTLSDRIDKKVLVAASELKVIATLSVGFDHINIEECEKRGIRVGNTPGVLTDATAELTVALLMATSRRLLEASQELRSGNWEPGWRHLWMCGPSISGSCVGIIGMGRIGKAVAERLIPFKPSRILYTGSSRKDSDFESKTGAQFIPLHQLLKSSDFVIVCCSLNDGTKGLIDERAFEAMKPEAIIINTSRGAVIDQKALVKALQSGSIRGAGLDVYEEEPLPSNDPLLKLSNVVLLPHIGSASLETRMEMARLTARNVISGLSGQELPGHVV